MARLVNETGPARLLTRPVSLFCPTSSRTLIMGFHPLFRFDCRRRSGLSVRSLAPHQAKPGILSGGVSSIEGPSCKRVSPARIPDPRLARRPRRQEIRSPPDRSCVTQCKMAPGHRAFGASGNYCGDRRSFHLAPKLCARKTGGSTSNCRRNLL